MDDKCGYCVLSIVSRLCLNGVATITNKSDDDHNDSKVPDRIPQSRTRLPRRASQGSLNATSHMQKQPRVESKDRPQSE